MAGPSNRASALTDLYIGTLGAAVALYSTDAKPASLPEGFVTAGPNGGELKYEKRAVEAPVQDGSQETVPVAEGAADPLADQSVETLSDGFEIEVGDPGPDPAAPFTVQIGGLVPGEFRQVLVEQGSGEVVESDAVRRGVRLENGGFVDCTDQIVAIEARTKLERMEVVRTIESTTIRRQRVKNAYYLGAQDGDAGVKLRLFYEALRKRREVAVVKYTTRSRQQLGVIEADGRTGLLMLLTLVWSEDWREAPAKAKAITAVQVEAAQVDAMAELLGALHGQVDVLDELRDEAIALREELLARAQAGEMTVSVVEPLETQEEVNLEDALTASLEAVRTGKV